MPLTKGRVMQVQGCRKKKSTKTNISRYYAISVMTGEVQDTEGQPSIRSCRNVKTVGFHCESSAEPSNCLKQGHVMIRFWF